METIPNLEVIKLEDLGFLGAGSFAQVRKAKYNNQLVAVKIFNQNHDSKNEVEFNKEVNELKRSNHENIIKIFAFGMWRDKQDLFKCIVIELADMGSLHHLLHETTLDYTLGHAVSWLLQTARAINYLHTRPPKPTIHRDLKPLNLLLMQGGTLLKVCDFGSACNLKTMMTVNKGSVCWMSPEVITNENYNEKCDCYSYAVVIFEVFSRQKPYFHLPNPNSNQIMFNVVLGKFRPKKIKNCPAIIDLLLERGLDGEPSKRPSMQMILNIMEKLDVLINKTPIKPLIDYSRSQSTSDTSSSKSNVSTYESNKADNYTMITTGEIDELLINNGDNNLVFRKKNSIDNQIGLLPPHRPVGHRKSKSIGTPLEAPKQAEIDQIISELNNRIETMLYDPIEPVYFDNQSIEIFKKHQQLIKEDEKVQRDINSNKKQLDQLQATIQNINLHKELTKQKNLLKQENEKLNKRLADTN